MNLPILRDFSVLNWHFHAHRSRYLQGYLFGILAFLFQIYLPFQMGHFVDEIRQNQLTFSSYLFNLILILICILLSYFCISYSDYQLFRSSGPVFAHLRERLLRGILYRPPTFFLRYKTGELTSLAMQDCSEITGIATYLQSFLNDSFIHLVILFLGTFLLIDPLLTCLALLPMIPMVLLCKWYARIWDSLAEPLQSSFETIYEDTLEVVNGLRVVRAYAMEESILKRFASGVQTNRQLALKQRLTLALYDVTIDSLIAASYLITLLYSAPKIAAQEMTIGTLLTFLLYLPLYIWPCMAAGEFLNSLSLSRASWKRLKRTLQQPDLSAGEHPAQKERRMENLAIPSPTPPEREAPGSILSPLEYEFRQFHYTYPQAEHPALFHINCQLRPGMTLGIVGRTGSGKSTLLRQFFAYDPIPNQGLLLCGHDIMDFDPLLYRKRIGYVPQEAQVFSMSLRENLKFFTPDLDDELLLEALHLASFEEDLETLPEGLNTLIGERGINLSGGQKQRISIARALLQNPELLLLDDSLSAVDPQTEACILGHLRQERRGKTTVITAHRLSCVRDADWIVVLDNGTIVEEGRHDQLMEQKGWYASQYRIQANQEGGEHEVLG